MRPNGIFRRRPVRRLLIVLLAIIGLAGCASPQLQRTSSDSGPARLGPGAAVMADGYRLPLRQWGDPDQAKSVLLALHGLNDYSNAFVNLGAYLAHRGILVYAYDQRGFGATAQRGRWAGETRMIADLQELTSLLRERHPRLPLFLLGESMGGAVAMSAAARGLRTDGIVLIAPAVWSRDTMNPIQLLVLETVAHTVPWLKLTGSGLNIRPSDNLDMLRALSKDPLVIKGTRVDALWGVTNIMDLGMSAAEKLEGPMLLLYGENDQIIPANAFCTMLDKMPSKSSSIRILLYEKGWHMLPRDLQGERVMADIAAWISDRNQDLPSSEEVQADSQRLKQLCRD